MVISHGYKFIFIHNYKVAGTSVREALEVYTIPPRESYWNWLRQKMGLLPQSSDFPDHISSSELKAKIDPRFFNGYFKFSFVRNPWDWQVSLYHFARQLKSHHQHELTLKMTFEEYVHWRVTQDKHLQKEFMYDDKGNCLVDYIGKIETIETDFKNITQILGIDATLAHANRSKHKPYQEYYTLETQKMIAEHFADDIELFGYEF